MERLRGLKQKYENFAEEHPLAATLGETAAVFVLKYGLEKAGNRVGVNLGHGRRNRRSRSDFIDNHPIAALTAVTVLAPISEELLFRALPEKVLEAKGHDPDSPVSKRTRLGVAALFATSHAGPDAMPLPQLIGGLHYNRIHRTRGLKYSMAAHVANNAMGAARFALSKRKKG